MGGKAPPLAAAAEVGNQDTSTVPVLVAPAVAVAAVPVSAAGMPGMTGLSALALGMAVPQAEKAWERGELALVAAPALLAAAAPQPAGLNTMCWGG